MSYEKTKGWVTNRNPILHCIQVCKILYIRTTIETKLFSKFYNRRVGKGIPYAFLRVPSFVASEISHNVGPIRDGPQARYWTADILKNGH
jgi:hypothetical protein